MPKIQIPINPSTLSSIPTFQEYFAALAIADWDFFLPRAHDNENPKPISERYRIFEPQWKEVILLWLGRQDAERDQFIQALVEFKDGCREWIFGYEGFYEYRAYFLAAAGIAEFRECSLANKIVKQVVKWSFGENFNYQMQQTQLRRTFAPRQMAERAKAILLEMHHPLAVNALIEVMHTSLDEYTRIEVAEIVGKIDPGNSVAIATLIEIMHNSERGWRTKAVRSLGKIAKSNQEAIAALVNLIHTIGENSDEWLIRVEAASSLSQIDPEHPDAIPVVEYSGLYSTFFQDAVRLGQINPNKPEWIAALVDQVKFNPTDEREEFNRLWAVQHLKASNTTEPEAVAALIDLIRSNPDDRTLLETVRSLGRIGKSAPEAIDLLIDLSYNSPNWVIREIAIQGLSYTDTSHEKVINALIELIRITPDQQIRIDAAQSLGQILQRYPLESAVSALKNTLLTQINDNNDVHLYKECYQVLLRGAQNMTYPGFYQAWHQQEEVDNTTTPNTQSLNQADLPQSLQSAIANDPPAKPNYPPNLHRRQPIHRTRSPRRRNIRPDARPELPRVRSVPETMPALKLYWNSLKRNSNKRPVLVFYASSTNPYSEAFLTDLSKFKGDDLCSDLSPSPSPARRGE
jgi:HEAT repeat protein